MFNKKIIILIICLIFILLSINIIKAQATPPTEYNLKTSSDLLTGAGGKIGYKTDADITIVVSQTIRLALSLLGIIFLILIIVGGYQWMTAGGNEEMVTKARQRIINAAIGLAIVLLAYAISYFIIYYITTQTITIS